MGAILIRPRRIPEALFAGAGAALLVVAHLISPLAALHAIEKGVAVYLFLIGMMALAELARHEGVFDWIAAFALEAARGSQARLFALVFGVGVVVTAILSNDATAVVLTPAIAATIARARVPPLPYLFACAFVANAASFVLPISNPANLVVFGDALPALGPWLAAFGIPALLAIAATFAALRFEWRTSLAAPCAQPGGAPPLSPAGRAALAAIIAAALGLVAAAATGAPLGPITFGLGVGATLAVGIWDRGAAAALARGISWGVVPLVAGLFVVVAALDASGLLGAAHTLFAWASAAPRLGAFGLGWAVALAAALANNLPVALACSAALHSAAVAPRVAHAALVAVDLGPNLAASGSLASLLWLVAVRRDGIEVSPLRFLRSGIAVFPVALTLALAAVR